MSLKVTAARAISIPPVLSRRMEVMGFSGCGFSQRSPQNTDAIFQFAPNALRPRITGQRIACAWASTSASKLVPPAASYFFLSNPAARSAAGAEGRSSS